MLNDQNQRFALRKLSIGLASVLIGISFISAGQTVKADTVQNNARQSDIVQNDQKAKENDIVKSAQDAQTHGDALNNSVVQVKRNSNKNAQLASKQMAVQSNVQNVNAREAKFDSVSQAEIINNQRVSQTTKVARISSAQDTVDVSSTDPNAKQTNKYRIIEQLPDNTTKVLAELDLTSHRSAVRNTSTNQVTYGDWSIDKAQLACPTNNSQAGDASQIFGIKVDNFANYTTHIPDTYSSNEVDSLGHSILLINNLADGLHLDVFAGTALETPATYKNPVNDYDFVITYTANTQDVSATDPNAKMLNNYKVIENLPNSNSKTVWDVDIESHRSAIKNLANGQVTYGDWETQKSVITNHTNNGNPGDPSFTPGINIDQVAGYTPVASSWQSSEKNNQGAWLINYVNDQNTFTFDFQPGVSGATPTTYKSMPANRVFYINYTANPQSITYTIHDDTANKDILTKTLTGVTDQTVNTGLALPNSNYALVQGNTIPSTYKFGATNNNVVIHVVHKMQDVSNTDQGAKQDNEYRIIEKLPNGTQKVLVDMPITSHRTATKDLVTGSVTYGDWDGSKASVYYNTALGSAVDQVAGYTVHIPTYRSIEKSDDGDDMLYAGPREAGIGAHSQDVNIDFINGNDSAKYKAMPKNQDFYITYTANPQSIKYTFVDDDDNGKEVLTKIVNGVTDQTVDTNLALPTNYVLAPNNMVPNTVKLGAVNNPVVIHVKHGVQDTTMTDPNASKKTVYRVIERMPNSHNKIVAEIDVISRKTATKDLVTGKTTYSDNYVYDKSSINAVIRNDVNNNDPTEILDAPIDQIPGYTISMNESWSNLQDSKGNNMLGFFSWKDGTYILDFVAGDGRGATYKNPPESQDFYINYVPTKQQVTLNYYDSDDHDKLVKSETVTGDYNSTIAIKPTDTDNYYFDLARGYSTEYHVGFTNDNKPVSIYLKHKTNNTYDFDTANRDIIVNLPNGIKHEYWQKIGFRRTKIVDLVTNQTTYGDWNVFDQTSAWRIDQTWQESKPYIIKNGAVRFAPINLPKVPGYRPILMKNT